MKGRSVIFKLFICVVSLCFAGVIFEIKYCLPHDSSMIMATTTRTVSHIMREIPDKDASSCISPMTGNSSSESMVFHNEQKWFDIDMCKNDSNSSLLTHDIYNKIECSHLMRFRFNQGRTGNQMFQVSSLLGAAMYHGYTPVIHTSFPLIKWFDLPNVVEIRSFANSRRFVKGVTVRNFDSRITQLSHDYNWTLIGYMHSWRYFEGAEPAIRKALMLKQNLVKEVKEFMKHAVNGIENSTAVCVHVRRGNFLKHKYKEQGCDVAPIRYLKDAMLYFRNKFTTVNVFVLSDKKKWLQNNMNWNNVTISPYNSVGLDMTLMSLCDHTIITGGTFGWWGAWLAGGDVIYWTGYPRKGSELDNRTCRYDFYPRDWIGMS